MKPLTLRQKAIDYRKQGYSYNLISGKLNLKKSTLAYWLKDIEYKPNEEVLKRINKNLRKFALYVQNKGLERLKEREKIKESGKREVGYIYRRDLWFIGSALYLAEGNKKRREVIITNSDPRVIKLMINWLVNICKISIKDIQAAVHIYPDNSERECINYWSKVTKIPKNQFSKSQVDKRLKKSKIKHGMLPYGTVHIRARKSTNLFYKISGWIDGILEKVNAGVVQR